MLQSADRERIQTAQITRFFVAMVTSTRFIFRRNAPALFSYRYRYGMPKNSLNEEKIKKDTNNHNSFEKSNQLILSCDVIAYIVFTKSPITCIFPH